MTMPQAVKDRIDYHYEAFKILELELKELKETGVEQQ